MLKTAVSAAWLAVAIPLAQAANPPANSSATPAATPAATPVVQYPGAVPGAQEHHPGKIIFTQLITPDEATEKTFYSRLFGWTFQDTNFGPTDLADAFLNGQRVAELIGRPMPPNERHQPVWLTFIATPTVDATAAAAVKQGGKLLFGPRDVPNLGREAVLSDPQGAVFAILAAATGDPPDLLPPDGAWIWSALATSNPDAAATFYQSLFNEQVYNTDPNGQHLILASDDYARASINPLPDKSDAHPYWLNFVRVADVAASANQAVSLGAHVLVAPQTDRHGGKVAVLADPTGVPFGLMEWTDDAEPGHAK